MSRSLSRAPAVRALCIQLLCFPLSLGLALGLPMAGGPAVSVGGFALLQGVLAAAVSYRCRLAPWWMLIQLVFPPALLVMLSVRLPSWLFLAGFLVLLALYWNTFRTQVPFYPSGPAAWRAVADSLPADRPLRFIDIGSGFGGLVRYLAARRPDCHCAGIELAPLPWLASRALARLRCPAATFLRGDYEALDFGDYDVVFAYLSPAAMPALWQKARREMRTGTLLLSYEFPVPGEAPHFTVMPEGAGAPLHGWHL